MKRKIWTVVGLLVSILLLTPLPVSAQALRVTPALSWDFGDIELGTSRSQIFTLTSTAPHMEAWVYVTEITPTDIYPHQRCGASIACDFAVTAIYAPGSVCPLYLPPCVIPYGGSIDVEVTFTPSMLGNREGFLYIHSNSNAEPYDGVAPQIYIPLAGWGVDATNNPGELIGGLLAFFDDSIDAGLLTGMGSGNSATGRLKAFGNMLKASSDLIEAHAYDLACTQLQDALNRTDGATRPPDFVAGTATGELVRRITEVMNALTCP